MNASAALPACRPADVPLALLQARAIVTTPLFAARCSAHQRRYAWLILRSDFRARQRAAIRIVKGGDA